ncbi:MAG TPA: hypothetical protein ENO20_14175 [Bacteroides sp.]|nr:hypothetical protein [Bacteroides sp.]
MKNDKKSGDSPEKEIIQESKENITEGARIFSEKASDIFSRFFDKVKDAAESAYEKGSEIYESLSVNAQNYAEKFRDRSEMRNLKEDRDEVAMQLGYMCFMEYSGRYKFRAEFLKNEDFKKLMSQMRALDKEIVQIGEKLEEEES